MSSLSFRLAKAVSDNRRLRWRSVNPEQVLAWLLVKRAEARLAGLDALEESLRQQIRWSLLVHRPEEDDRHGRDDPAAVHDRL